MEAKDAVRKTGEIRWFGQLKSTSTYIIGLDPCIGTGSDFSAIEVFSLPGLQQVAEWQHNKTDVRKQILVLQEILDEIHKVQEDENNIYYSIENNGIGKASIQVLEELGLQNFYGVLVNEPKLRGQKFYKGMVTTLNNKLEACARLKYFVENQKIKIYSRNLIKQLKVFVARGRSFAAKDGEHDDLVMAAVLCVRIVQTLTKHDEGAYEELIDPLGTDPSDLPMPIGFI
jgi:hypothetical protein